MSKGISSPFSASAYVTQNGNAPVKSGEYEASDYRDSAEWRKLRNWVNERAMEELAFAQTKLDKAGIEKPTRLTYSELKRALAYDHRFDFYEILSSCPGLWEPPFGARLAFEIRPFHLKFEGAYQESKSTVRVNV